MTCVEPGLMQAVRVFPMICMTNLMFYVLRLATYHTIVRPIIVVVALNNLHCS